MVAVELAKPLQNKGFWHINGLWVKWRPVDKLLLLRTVADLQSAIGPTHQLSICRFRAGDVCVQPDLRDDELIRLSDKSCHSTDQVATSETDPNVWTGCCASEFGASFGSR